LQQLKKKNQKNPIEVGRSTLFFPSRRLYKVVFSQSKRAVCARIALPPNSSSRPGMHARVCTFHLNSDLSGNPNLRRRQMETLMAAFGSPGRFIFNFFFCGEMQNS
jgi:hypothetical protein